MNLRNNLYYIKGKSGDGCTATYTVALNGECEVFQAHFPGQPITPGVCILQMVTELLEDCTGRQLAVTRVKNAKFLTVLTPGEASISVSLTNVREDNGVYSAQSVLSDANGTVYAKISIEAVAK